MTARETLPMLVLAILAITVAVNDALSKRRDEQERLRQQQPRCEYMDVRVHVNIPVSSEKECDRIKKARQKYK